MKATTFYRVLLSLTLIFLSSCVNYEAVKKYQALKNSNEFQREKEILKSRLGGKSLCPDMGVSDLIFSDTATPSKDCLYPSSKLTVYGRELRQSLNTIKVLQVMSSGFIVNAQYTVSYGGNQSKYSSERAAFIKKSDESNVVDGMHLDPAHNWDLYEYTGVHQYKSLIGGSNTVHSFRKISEKEWLNAKKDLKTYGMFKEFFIEKELWYWVKTVEEQQSMKIIVDAK